MALDCHWSCLVVRPVPQSGAVVAAQVKRITVSRTVSNMSPRKKLSPSEKARQTAKLARTMTKWLVTYRTRTGARWNLVEFGGKTGAEARGIVDMIAIRKDHRGVFAGVKRGDLFEIVLIQTKGGSSPRPTADDVRRLQRVARHHKARAVVLAEWQLGERLDLFKLSRGRWKPVSPREVFG